MPKITDFFIKNQKYSITITRIGLALVLLWFGIDELLNPEKWFSYIPSWLPSIIPFNIESFIILNGLVEIIIGILLLIGLYTRIIAFFAALHLLSITIAVGYNDIGIRDFGLLAMAISLVFSGAGFLSLDNRNKNEENI